jgi:hypothetical protein
MSLGRSVRAGEAFVQLSLRDQMTKGLQQASRRLTSFGAGAAKIGAGIMGAGLAGGALLLPTIKAASDMQETMSKFGVVFGAQSDATKAWADGFAEEVGRSKQQIASFMAGSQDLFVPLGIEPGAANALSKQLTGLAIDLASFNNMADADVLENLQAALTGSGAVMKKYGVILNEATTQQELLNMGMDPKNASEAAKVQARMNIIMRGTTAAHGDAVRTGDSYANQMKRLTATLDDLKVTIGAELLPIATDAVKWMVDSAKAAGDWIGQNRALVPIVAKGVVVVAAAGAGLMTFGVAAMVAGKAVAAASVLTSAGFAAIGAASSIAMGPIGLIAAALVGGTVLWARYTESGQAATESLKSGLLDFRDIGLETFEGVREALQDGDLAGAAEIALAGLGAAWNEGLAKLMSSWGTWITGLVETFAGASQEIAKMWLGTVGQIAKGILTMAQQEGVVGDVMAQVLGVDIREEQRRNELITQQLNPVRKRNLETGIADLEAVQERLQAGDIEGARALDTNNRRIGVAPELVQARERLLAGDVEGARNLAPDLVSGTGDLTTARKRLQAGDLEGARDLAPDLVTGDFAVDLDRIEGAMATARAADLARIDASIAEGVEHDLVEVSRGLRNLREELGQPLQVDDLFADARRQIDSQTRASQQAVEDRVGAFMAGYADFADPDRLRAEADARRRQIVDLRQQQREARELAERQRAMEAANRDYEAMYGHGTADDAAAGVEVAQGVASAGTFDKWRIEGVFGLSREEEQLEEARTTNHELRAIHGVLRRVNLSVVG